MAELLTNVQYTRDSKLYFITAGVIIAASIYLVFGGVKRVSRFTDKLVPIMSCSYILLILIIAVCNVQLLPAFFRDVVFGAFKPQAMFGGLFGVTLMQGMKRGLMSNEAGMGTATMFAASAEADHPCEQGMVQSISVFVDSIVICTLTGFVVAIAHLWTGEAGVDWNALKGSGIGLFLVSLSEVLPGTAFDGVATFIVAFSYGLFSYTTLMGQVSCAEIAANGIRKDKRFINAIRLVSTVIAIPFGVLAVLAGLELGNFWYIADFLNVLVVFVNVPIIVVGYKYAKRAIQHYQKNDGTAFSSDIVGIKTEYWDERAESLNANSSSEE